MIPALDCFYCGGPRGRNPECPDHGDEARAAATIARLEKDNARLQGQVHTVTLERAGLAAEVQTLTLEREDLRAIVRLTADLVDHHDCRAEVAALKEHNTKQHHQLTDAWAEVDDLKSQRDRAEMHQKTATEAAHALVEELIAARSK